MTGAKLEATISRRTVRSSPFRDQHAALALRGQASAPLVEGADGAESNLQAQRPQLGNTVTAQPRVPLSTRIADGQGGIRVLNAGQRVVAVMLDQRVATRPAHRRRFEAPPGSVPVTGLDQQPPTGREAAPRLVQHAAVLRVVEVAEAGEPQQGAVELADLPQVPHVAAEEPRRHRGRLGPPSRLLQERGAEVDAGDVDPGGGEADRQPAEATGDVERPVAGTEAPQPPRQPNLAVEPGAFELSRPKAQVVLVEELRRRSRRDRRGGGAHEAPRSTAPATSRTRPPSGSRRKVEPLWESAKRSSVAPADAIAARSSPCRPGRQLSNMKPPPPAPSNLPPSAPDSVASS